MSLGVWVITACSVAVVLSRNDLEEGYYWRQYKEEIPPDALLASANQPGENVYIAQTVHRSSYVPNPYTLSPVPYHRFGYGYGVPPPFIRFGRSVSEYPGSHKPKSCTNNIIVTGQIRGGQKEMEYEWGNRRQVAGSNVQILCTGNPGNFEWLETNTTDIVNLQDRHLVSGGLEQNYTVYIGRVILDDEVFVGKVLYTHLDYMDGFYSIANGSFVHIYSSFEVLAYNLPKNG